MGCKNNAKSIECKENMREVKEMFNRKNTQRISSVIIIVIIIAMLATSVLPAIM